MLTTIRVMMCLPLVVCLSICIIYLVQRLEDKRASPRWRAIATFSFFFAVVYSPFAFFFLQQVASYVSHK